MKKREGKKVRGERIRKKTEGAFVGRSGGQDKCHSQVGLFCQLSPTSHTISPQPAAPGGRILRLPAVFQFPQPPIFWGLLPVKSRPQRPEGGSLQEAPSHVCFMGAACNGHQSEAKSQAWPVGQFPTPGHAPPTPISHQGSFCV